MINITALPLDYNSLLIRAIVNKREQLHTEFKEGQIITSVAQKLKSFIQLYEDGRYDSYREIATLDYIY